MTIYTITADNNVTAHDSLEEACSVQESEQFNSLKKLEKLAADWPSARLVEIWNSLPGQKPVKKFTDRKTAVARIWAALEKLVPSDRPDEEPAEPIADEQVALTVETDPDATTAPDEASKFETDQEPPADVVAGLGAQTPPVAPEPPPAAEQATAPEKPRVARDGSKTAQVLELLKRPGGATLKDIMNATNWQAHSVRGFIAGTVGKKMGLAVTSAKREDGERAYSLPN